MTIQEEIKFALECANKDIDLMPEQEEYMRGYLGGQLSIVGILENHLGKFINDDKIYKEKTKTGKWEVDWSISCECPKYICSVCGEAVWLKTDRCPKCKAIMKGEQE